MNNDPFYSKIVSRLSGKLDGDHFEHCAVDLIRPDFKVVPVKGGSDAGMDGAVGDGHGEPFPLVCTTQKDVKANLEKSLRSYLKNKGKRRRVIVATSQRLTPQQQKKIYEAAQKMKFTIVQMYEQTAIADRLYHNSKWCKDLLRLTGNPPPLSIIPLSKRPFMGLETIGRSEDLKWIESTDGDLVISGQPGSGKTFLLHHLAKQGKGLFVVSPDRADLAEAIRDQEPSVLFVDDAHVNPNLLLDLQQIRKEVGAKFKIIATCWPKEHEAIVTQLGLSGRSLHELELLSRNEILELIRACGIYGPERLQYELINQAEGRPGLAVTLCHICWKGDLFEIELGTALTRDIGTFFDKTIGEQARYVLAGFAVGGNVGMTMQAIADYMKISNPEIMRIVAGLDSGGVLIETNRGTLSVRPPALREALLRDTFFNGAKSLPIIPLLDAVPSPPSALLTLLNAYRRQTKVPRDLLIQRLEAGGDAECWKSYAALGKDETDWVLENHPDRAMTIAEIALHTSSEAIIPALLDQAVGDERALNQHPSHPMRMLKTWVESAPLGTAEVVARRKTLIDAVLLWHEQTKNRNVTLHALSIALSPAFDDTNTDIGDGMKITMSFGSISDKDIEALKAEWPKILELIQKEKPTQWEPLLSVASDYFFGRDLRGQFTKATALETYKFGFQMIKDIAASAENHQGILHWAISTTKLKKRKIAAVLDPEFEVLFPPRESFAKSTEERQGKAAKKLAAQWLKGNPSEIAKRYQLFCDQAQITRTYPQYGRYVFYEIAQQTSDPYAWISALTDGRIQAEALDPFLWKIAKDKLGDWETILEKFLGVDLTRSGVIQIILSSTDASPALITKAIERLNGYQQTVEFLAMKHRIPESTLTQLLEHENVEISTAAALGEWHASDEGNISNTILPTWRKAVIKAKNDHHWLNDIFEKLPDIAYEWALNLLQSRDKDSHYWQSNDTLDVALRVLAMEKRKELLNIIPPEKWWDEAIRSVIRNDIDVYRLLLSKKEFRRFHLAPLRGHPKGDWIERAKLALDAGFSTEDIAYAIRSGSWGWSGHESVMWQGWIEDFDSLSTDMDNRIAEIGRIAAKYAREMQQNALKRERHEAVYGFGRF